MFRTRWTRHNPFIRNFLLDPRLTRPYTTFVIPRYDPWNFMANFFMEELRPMFTLIRSFINKNLFNDLIETQTTVRKHQYKLRKAYMHDTETVLITRET